MPLIDVPGIGTLRVDVAYGGMIYCLVEARDLGLTLERPETAGDIDPDRSRQGGARSPALVQAASSTPGRAASQGRPVPAARCRRE